MPSISTVVYPGTFDPITLGHLDLIKRSSKFFEKTVVAISRNREKKALFTAEERKDMIEKVMLDLGLESRVRVSIFDSLLSDYLNKEGYHLILRGLRAISDFEFELQLANTNRILNTQVETIFFSTATEYSYISSSLVKEIVNYGGDSSKFVHPIVIKALTLKINQIK